MQRSFIPILKLNMEEAIEVLVCALHLQVLYTANHLIQEEENENIVLRLFRDQYYKNFYLKIIL